MVNRSKLASSKADCFELHLKRSLFLARDKVVKFLSPRFADSAVKSPRQPFGKYCEKSSDNGLV